MRIWMNENDGQNVYIDTENNQEVVTFTIKNSIFFDKIDENVLTYNTKRFSMSMTARNLKALVEFYKCHGWEVTEDVQAITEDFVKRAKEERERREEEKYKKYFEESQKKEIVGIDRPYYKIVMRNGTFKHRLGRI